LDSFQQCGGPENQNLFVFQTCLSNWLQRVVGGLVLVGAGIAVLVWRRARRRQG